MMRRCCQSHSLPSLYPVTLLTPHRHIEDYRAALDYVRGPALVGRVDSSRLALWGTSFAGGHVIKVAAADVVPDRVGSIRAVVSQVTGGSTFDADIFECLMGLLSRLIL